MHIRSLATGFAISFFTLVSTGAQAQTAFDIPTTLTGTYNLLVPSYNGELPFTRGSTIKIVVNGSTDTVCIGGVEQKASRTTSTSPEVFDVIHAGGLSFRLIFSSGSFLQMTAENKLATGTRIGDATFTSGSRQSTATDCTASRPQLSTAEQSLFSLAEFVYPSLLKDGTAAGIYQGFVYKYFPSSKIYVGIKGTTVYTLGGPFGTEVKNQGSTANLVTALQSAKTKIELNSTGDAVTLASMSPLACALETTIASSNKSNSPLAMSLNNSSQSAVKIWWLDLEGKRTLYYTLSPGLSAQLNTFPNHLWLVTDTNNSCLGIYATDNVTKANVSLVVKRAEVNTKGATTWTNGDPVNGGGTADGLYLLTLTGSVRTSGFTSVSVPINLSINGLPAPSVNDTTLIVDQVRTQLGASGVANVKVTSINNTASRVTFRVEFTAVLSTLGAVTYDLTYDYTR
jgi:VHL beta domain